MKCETGNRSGHLLLKYTVPYFSMHCHTLQYLVPLYFKSHSYDAVITCEILLIVPGPNGACRCMARCRSVIRMDESEKPG